MPSWGLQGASFRSGSISRLVELNWASGVGTGVVRGAQSRRPGRIHASRSSLQGSGNTDRGRVRETSIHPPRFAAERIPAIGECAVSRRRTATHLSRNRGKNRREKTGEILGPRTQVPSPPAFTVGKQFRRTVGGAAWAPEPDAPQSRLLPIGHHCRKQQLDEQEQNRNNEAVSGLFHPHGVGVIASRLSGISFCNGRGNPSRCQTESWADSRRIGLPG